MSSREAFAESAARLVALHGGDEYAIAIRDPRVTYSLTSGPAPSPRTFSAPCTMPTPYSPGMVDGERIKDGDASVWIAGEAAEITFEIEPEMIAVVTGPHLGTSGQQFSIGPRGVTRHAGGLEVHLRSGVPA